MNKWKQHIPAGVQDYLPQECYNKKNIENTIRKVFFLNGYDEIETPVFEYFDVFAGEKASIKQEQMFKVLEAGGRILVLRPDITMPIARISATKLKKNMLPLRLSYIDSVYRYEELQIGKQREVAQAGIELLGVKGPEADAEIISTAIEVLLKLGLKAFQIDIGQVEFFKGLLQQSGLDEEQAEELRGMIDHKNMLALEIFLKDLSISNELKEILLGLPALYGNSDMLDKAMNMSNNQRCKDAITNIKQVYEILRDYGLDKYITFDLGMVQSLNYYTGIIFRGITSGLGYPICGGGRYDNLVSEFGLDLPATGFALGIKRILTVLERQHGLMQIPSIDVLVAFDQKSRKEGYSVLHSLKTQGQRVELFLVAKEQNDPLSYARAKGIKKLIRIDNSIIREIDIQSGKETGI